LRADGHRRNPGTTADLVASSLFAFLLAHPDRLDVLNPQWRQTDDSEISVRSSN
jgi:hypothetical protein